MNFGLRQADLEYIRAKMQSFEEIERAVLFGSRAKGNHKRGSDIDVAIFGPNVTFDTVSSLHAMLEYEGPLPYLFDIVDYNHLENNDLKKHIDRVGKVIYEKVN